MPDPTVSDLRVMRDHLQRVPRVFISGGEPLLRTDLPEVVSLFPEEVVLGLATNAAAGSDVLRQIGSRLAFVNIGLDGPRNITSRVRGDYDEIIKGVEQFRSAGVPLSLTGVVLRSTVRAVPFLCQIADDLGARKVKLVLPIPKGNALNLEPKEYLDHGDCEALSNMISQMKAEFGWTPVITLTEWGSETEGYSILVYPNGEAFAWPVMSEMDKVLPVGNLLEESIEAIWERYPYKENHLRKYLGRSIRVL